jgi:hypothetical protein
MLEVLAAAFIVGLTHAVPPGPITFEVLRRGAVDGLVPALKVDLGAIVQATGARPYDARKLGHLGYGASPDVVTSAELDAMLAKGALARPSDGKRPGRVAFVQCAGSRDPAHLPYCSSECCGTSLRQVMAIQQAWPEVECAVLYKDVRTPAQGEHFYRAVQERSTVMLARGTVEGVAPSGGRLRVSLKDSILGERVAFDADLVVLAVGQVPNSADGEAIRQLRDARKRIEKNESETQRKAAEELAASLAHHDGTAILNLAYRQGPDLPVLQSGFPDSHFICFQDVKDAWFADWRQSQAKILDEIDAYFAPTPVKRVPLFTHEVLGRERLEERAWTMYEDAEDPAKLTRTEAPYTFSKVDGHYEIRLNLPFAAKGEIGLFKKGDELVVEIGTLRRHIGLPTSMASLNPSRATLEDRVLTVEM